MIQYTVSIVSHGQAVLAEPLVRQILADSRADLRVILTLNIPEDERCLAELKNDDRLIVIRNKRPKGFGENHNAAFLIMESSFFVVLNPDIELSNLSFRELAAHLENKDVGVVAPLVLSPSGRVEDSARAFPTLASLFRRSVLKVRTSDYHLLSDHPPVRVDWIAGMFLMFRSETFRAVRGFNELYFLYVEDVDLCWRLKQLKLDRLVIPQIKVVHNARRASRRNWTYLKWHVGSLVRYFLLRRLIFRSEIPAHCSHR